MMNLSEKHIIFGIICNLKLQYKFYIIVILYYRMYIFKFALII